MAVLLLRDDVLGVALLLLLDDEVGVALLLLLVEVLLFRVDEAGVAVLLLRDVDGVAVLLLRPLLVAFVLVLLVGNGVDCERTEVGAGRWALRLSLIWTCGFSRPGVYGCTMTGSGAVGGRM